MCFDVSTTLTKAVKKEIIKNHLLGLEEDESLRRLASSGSQLDLETIRATIDEFGTESEKRGLTQVAKAYGFSRLAKELGEVANFKRKNGIELSDMVRGAKIARVLKEYGAGIPELEQFLSTAYSRASQKGYNAETLVGQISALNDLEKKYGANFDELKSEYEKLGAAIKSQLLERKHIVGEIEQVKKQKSEIMSQMGIDERKMEEYNKTRQNLLSLGFNMDNLGDVKEFLLAIKAQEFDPIKVISKINSIGELEKEKAKLEQETSATNDELNWKKALLSELRKLQETNLSIEQVDNIRKIVVKISTDRGIDKSSAYAQFEEDIVRNYDSVLGIKSAVACLNESEKRLVTENDKIKQQLEGEEAAHSEKLKRIEEKYSKIATEIESYNDLKEIGVDAKRILVWHEIIESSGLDFATVESELKKHASLRNREREINLKIESLTSEAVALKETVANLKQEKANVETSIKALSDVGIAEVNSASSKILSSISDMNEKAQSIFARITADNERALNDIRASSEEGIKKAVIDSKGNLEATVNQLNSSVEDFSLQIKNAIDEAIPQMKNVTAALEAGEKLGKYKNILPLLDLLDEKNVSETEALISMWNVTNRFNIWAAEHYRASPKAEISGALSKLVASLSEEIQRIN